MGYIHSMFVDLYFNKKCPKPTHQSDKFLKVDFVFGLFLYLYLDLTKPTGTKGFKFIKDNFEAKTSNSPRDS